MYTTKFRFHGQLNNFLPHQRREKAFDAMFKGERSIKDMIESLGVPHTEVALIRVNDQSVDFNYRMRHGDVVEVFPPSALGDATPHPNVHPALPDVIRFVADVHLGRLVAHLRMLGFDTLYPEDYRDEELARISSEEERILLTRDVGLLKRGIVRYGYFVQQIDPWEQVVEVIQRFDLLNVVTPFSRCTVCNGVLQYVSKESVQDELLSKTLEYYDVFYRCVSCRKVYWKGSHYANIERKLNELRGEGG
jgi:uncharacterized protein